MRGSVKDTKCNGNLKLGKACIYRSDSAVLITTDYFIWASEP